MKMKKGPRCLLIAGAMPVLIILIIFLYLNVTGKDARQAVASQAKSTPLSSKTYDLKDFSEVSVNGSCSLISITQRESVYMVKLIGPKDILDVVKVEKTGARVSVALEKPLHSNPDTTDDLSILIILPRITAIDLSGVTPVNLVGIDADTLSINTQGVTRFITQSDEGSTKKPECSFKTLILSGSGILDANLINCITTNAVINYQGTYDIILTMNGGSLSGNLGGIGRLDYIGNVTRNEIKVSDPAGMVVY
jgi:hypothetical protein